MERTLDVPTAESVELRYDLAGVGSRFLAVAVDLGLQGVVAVTAVLLVLVSAQPLITFVSRAGLRDPVSATLIAVLVIATFVVFFGYFIIFEVLWNGRTPGKRALGLRVIRSGGFPVDISASVVRNVVRILEAGIGFYAISAIVALRSPRNQRIGDYAAGTIVVWDRPIRAGILDVLAATITERDDGLTPADRELIGRFLDRRADLEPAARRTIAAAIATRVRPRLAASFAHLDDESLLDHLGRPG